MKMNSAIYVFSFVLAIGSTLAFAERGRIPTQAGTDWNGLILDYVITGAFIEKREFTENTETLVGKFDPSLDSGNLRISGRAQWLSYPGPDYNYPWRVVVTAFDKMHAYEPMTNTQEFDLSVPIGNATSGNFQITVTRSSNYGDRAINVTGHLEGNVVTGPSTSTDGKPKPPPTGGETGTVQINSNPPIPPDAPSKKCLMNPGPTLLTASDAEKLLDQEMTPKSKILLNQVFFNGNDFAVFNGGSPAQFTIDRAKNIDFIMTYHYNQGQGAPAGTITLRRTDGLVCGPFQAALAYNFYWIIAPRVVLPSGTYEVIDSDPATWSQNQGAGHVLIKGTSL